MASMDSMMQTLTDVGVLPETARVAAQQYKAVENIDPWFAMSYASEVRERVTSAYERILAKYVEQFSDSEGNITNDDYRYAEQYTSAIVNANMDWIISDFKQRYSEDVAMGADGHPINVGEKVSYNDYEPVSTFDHTRAKDYLEQLQGQVEKINEREIAKQKKAAQRENARRKVEQRPMEYEVVSEGKGTKLVKGRRLDYNEMDIKDQIRERMFDSMQTQVSERVSTPISEQLKDRTNRSFKQQWKQRVSKPISEQVKTKTKATNNKSFTNKVKSAFNKAINAVKSFFKRG